MKLLSIKDFKDTKFDSNWNPFDYLLEVARIGQERMQKQNAGMKRKYKHKEEDEDEEWEGLKLKRSKKERPVGLNPPVPDLPENFKQHIVEKMGGSNLVLVIQKSLFFSDVNPQASRFAMPFSQLKTHEFLNKTETEDLKDVKKAIKVCLLEPSMKENCDITFKRWNMSKCSMYVMNGAWNSVVENNGLKIDDIVQLWSFRVKSDLCFALVKVQVPTRN